MNHHYARNKSSFFSLIINASVAIPKYSNRIAINWPPYFYPCFNTIVLLDVYKRYS